jgi:hypothetical protein
MRKGPTSYANYISLPARFGAMSTTLAIAPAYEAVISVTAQNQAIRTSVMLHPK